MSKKTTQASTLSMKVSNDIKVLAQMFEKREEELAGILTDAVHEDSDVEDDSASPILDPFSANSGLQTFLEMCQLKYNEFEHFLNTCCQIFSMQKVTLGQGEKQMWHQKTSFFIVLCVLKAVTNWDLIGEIFETKGLTLQRLFSSAVNI